MCLFFLGVTASPGTSSFENLFVYLLEGLVIIPKNFQERSLRPKPLKHWKLIFPTYQI